MKLTKLPGVLALILLTSLCGCVTTGPATASAADGEDEYEGRFFSWEFEVKSDPPPSEQPSSNQSTTVDARSSANATATPATNNPPPAKHPIRIRYSTDDDENGDRGFIIHSGEDSDYDED